MIIRQIENFANSMYSAKRNDFQYNTTYELVLKQGMLFKNQTLPANFKEMEAGYCFYNAVKLITHHDHLTYCEGYATIGGGKDPLPMLHAWCSDNHGNVVDPTWPYNKKRQYLGIPFDTIYVILATLRKRTAFSLIDDYENRWPLLRKFPHEAKKDIYNEA